MKKYLVIGGSSGVGKATVEKLAAEGYFVYATYHNSIQNDTDHVSYHALNVLDDDLNLDFIDSPLDGLVYCPGAINLKPFKAIKPELFIEDYKLQVLGLIKVVKKALRNLNPGASMVFFSTVAVQKGFGFHSLVGSSKGAIEGLTKSLAAELAPKYRVNTIAPSLVDTPMAANLLNTEEKIQKNNELHPLKRIGSPEDIANTVTFLLSEQSSWMTGQIVHIDGGKSTLNK